ncbi:alkene reductase [Ponticoccus alexandrii]|uniref:N-ethylmaleimide reductase n=1 Tax=Ponticoccus alexandrii TaxID=1943633 RepID=A0ABX7FAF2_9RHOB|nr:alkene reductase [Ponticoccus alexandrii]ETA54018.1 NADH:flavin oxidoreductase [Rhodobacteraceae bacterium PD-2]QRF66342.1 N-ethylmaleimide reductase [Ponticoccus alexandrii]
MSTLFDPLKVGAIDLKNRVVMAPLTRNRAFDGDAPSDMHVDYYRQRAGAGLIITEASQITPEGKGYAWTPGIYSAAQIAGWKKVTDAVHEAGGKIVIQLWHVGRISHTSLQEGGKAPVAPSAIRAEGVKTFDGAQMVEVSEPRALEADELPRIVEAYAQATRNAREAGFDGVEVHGANGYLLDQFLKDGTNTREDPYGGSYENRAKLLGQVLDAVTDAWDAAHVGLRISPYSGANGATDSDPKALGDFLVDFVSGRGLAYLHLIEGQTGGSRDLPEGVDLKALKARFDGAWMVNNGYDRQMALDAVSGGDADLVAFGRPYIANPDLAERLKVDAALNEGDPSTYYGGGREGYTDYPTMQEEPA